MLVLAVLGGTARADTPVDRPQAFEVDREAPPPGQGELGFDGGAPVAAWAASIQLGYLDRPMRLETLDIVKYPVRRRETLALGGAYSIGKTVVVDARLPMAHQVGDRNKELGDSRPLDRWVFGDLGLGVRIRVVERDELSAFARANLTLGTGDDFDYAGEARFTIAWMLIGRFYVTPGVIVAATAGVRIRGAEVIVADRLLGDELFGGVGATYDLPAVEGVWCEANQMRLSAEVVGVLGNTVGDKLGPSPIEARVGWLGQVRPWLGFAVRAGKGLDDHIGAPRIRMMAELIYEAE